MIAFLEKKPAINLHREDMAEEKLRKGNDRQRLKRTRKAEGLHGLA